MKVLFVRSANNGISPITTQQAISLREEGCIIKFYDIKGKKAIGYIKNLKSLRSMIKDFNPDIIHAHYSMSGILCFLSNSGIPTGISFMGSDIIRSSKLMNSVNILLSRFFYQFIIVKSSEMHQLLRVKKAKILGNGVNLNIMKTKSKTEAQEFLKWDTYKKHILFPANPTIEVKNYPLAKSFFDEIKRKTNEEIELHFLNNIKFENVHYYYNASDLVLFTSSSEGSPNVIKEAMACNCPIITTDVGDVKQLLKNTSNWCLLNPKNINESLKFGLAVLKSGVRSNGRKSIQDLSSSRVAKKIISIYKNAMN